MDHLNKADAGTDPLQSLIFLGLIPNLHFLLPVAIILLIWSLKNRKASKETVILSARVSLLVPIASLNNSG